MRFNPGHKDLGGHAAHGDEEDWLPGMSEVSGRCKDVDCECFKAC